MGGMTNLRSSLVLAATLGLLMSATVASADQTSDEVPRGIRISAAGLDTQNRFGVKLRWDVHDLRSGKKNALSVALVATKNGVGIPVFQRAVKAKADQSRKHYRFSLNRAERRLVRKADGLGVAASQRLGLQDGLYRRAWVARDGKFPKVGQSGATLAASRCNPVQSAGTYNGCYYGYTDLSSMNLSSASFSDAQFPFSTLKSTNFSGSNLTFGQFGYAMMNNANLSNADLSTAYMYGANMTGATMTGTIVTGTQYCNTIMPNGTTNNTSC